MIFMKRKPPSLFISMVVRGSYKRYLRQEGI